MKKIILALLIGASAALSGCATIKPPTDYQVSVAEYGNDISPAIAEAKIIEFMKGALIDPESARYRSSTKVQKHWMVDSDGKYHYGYATAFFINAKNRMGGYTGEKRYIIIFYKGEVFRICESRYGDTDIYPNAFEFGRYLHL